MTRTGPVPALPATNLDVANISTDTSRLASRANLEKAGRQFEAVFTQMMLKSMRQPHLAEDLFGSKAQDMFREMQDKELSLSMAQAKPLGIGKAMVEFLSRSQPDLQVGSAGPEASAP